MRVCQNPTVLPDRLTFKFEVQRSNNARNALKPVTLTQNHLDETTETRKPIETAKPKHRTSLITLRANTKYKVTMEKRSLLLTDWI